MTTANRVQDAQTREQGLAALRRAGMSYDRARAIYAATGGAVHAWVQAHRGSPPPLPATGAAAYRRFVDTTRRTWVRGRELWMANRYLEAVQAMAVAATTVAQVQRTLDQSAARVRAMREWMLTPGIAAARAAYARAANPYLAAADVQRAAQAFTAMSRELGSIGSGIGGMVIMGLGLVVALAFRPRR